MTEPETPYSRTMFDHIEHQIKRYTVAGWPAYTEAYREDRAEMLDKAWDEAHADPRARLEYLRGEIDAERISYGEIAELQDYGHQGLIDPGDVQLLEWAGVPEFPEDGDDTHDRYRPNKASVDPGSRDADGAPVVTVDDDDRDNDPINPWTVSCRVCDEGIAFFGDSASAFLAAGQHLIDHRDNNIKEN